MKRIIIIGNGEEWCKFSWAGINKDNNIRFIKSECPFKYGSFMFKIWIRIFIVQRRTNFQFIKTIWFNCLIYYLKISKNTKYLIFYDRSRLNTDFDFLNYVSKKFPQIKKIYLFSNIVSISGAKDQNILASLKDFFDLVFAFDKMDASKYGFHYSPLIYTGIDKTSSTQSQSDLFYLGRAKDRFYSLIEIFEKATKAGLKCSFHIFGVPEEEQVYKDIIEYNVFMPYETAIGHIMNTKCLVDVIQENSTGLTIKVCESLLYNKKLITTNEYIKDEPFYNSNNILIYSTNSDIGNFLNTPIDNYKESDKLFFSPYRLFEQIDQILSTK